MNDRPKKRLDRATALAKLQRYCAYQDRCHQEVRSKLLEWGVYGDDLEEIMVALIEDKFLDEERFARSYARGKFRIKQWGRQRIVNELKQRRITAYCIRQALTEIDEQAYREQLLQLLQQRYPSLSGDDFERRQKLARWAVGRGYESELVWELLGTLS